jgi:hypothetical protein
MRKRAPSQTEKTAAALLQIKRGDEWLIPEPLRSSGDAKAICAHVQWDHKFLHAFGGDTAPQNIQPLSKLEHKGKTRRDRMLVTKAKRIEKKHEEFQRQLLAPTPKAPAKLTKKGYRPMPCGRNSNQKMTIKGKVVPRPPRLAKLSVVLRHPERDGD